MCEVVLSTTTNTGERKKRVLWGSPRRLSRFLLLRSPLLWLVEGCQERLFGWITLRSWSCLTEGMPCHLLLQVRQAWGGVVGAFLASKSKVFKLYYLKVDCAQSNGPPSSVPRAPSCFSPPPCSEAPCQGMDTGGGHQGKAGGDIKPQHEHLLLSQEPLQG